MFLHSQVGLLKGSAFGVDLGVRTEMELGGGAAVARRLFGVYIFSSGPDGQRTHP